MADNLDKKILFAFFFQITFPQVKHLTGISIVIFLIEVCVFFFKLNFNYLIFLKKSRSKRLKNIN